MTVQIQNCQPSQPSLPQQVEKHIETLKVVEPEVSRTLRTSLRLFRKGAASSLPHLTDSSANSALKDRDCASSCPFKYRLAATPQIAPRGHYVGQLQERWQFPSDHLPIGMKMGGLKMASWNVLNTAYMSWVLENSQGLSRSLIAEENLPLGSSNITVREQHVIDSLKEMMQGQSLISLQECGKGFLKELENQLPAGWKLVREKGGNVKDQNALLYNSNLLELKENRSVQGLFSIDPKRAGVQDALFERRDGNGLLRIINVHLPGEPGNPAPRELAEYLKVSDNATLVMGDMNFNEFQMADGFQGSSYQLFFPYCTNITPYSFESKAIDHFFVKAPDPVQLQSADELLPGLQSTVDLLEP